MTNKKSTKRALIASVLALVMCVSMLVGSTYAWFTDSVSSVNNVIKSGNLDVELEYSTDGENWIAVDDETSIFSDETLWEPGHTEAVALRIKNVGTLALKYELNTSVYLEKEGTNVYGEKFLLSDYLKVGYSAVQEDGVIGDIYMGLLLGDRAAITESNGVVPMDFIGFNKTANNPTPTLEPGVAHVTVLAITMPTTVGNEANYMTGTEAPYIRFGINLYATQWTSEADSFGTDYDADADFLKAPVADVTNMPAVNVAATYGMGGDLIDGGVDLDAAFSFKTTETYEEAQQSDYRYWHADFVVSADKDIPDGALALAGYYGAYCDDYNDGNWVALINEGMPVAANEEVRLLELMLNGGSMSYEELCNWVPEFKCGLSDLQDLAGTTITVELRLYEVTENSASTEAETGHYVTVGTYSHTFN